MPGESSRPPYPEPVVSGPRLQLGDLVVIKGNTFRLVQLQKKKCVLSPLDASCASATSTCP